MTSLLDEILEKCKQSELDEQVRILCDKIMSEQIGDPDEVEYKGPKGSNVFLSLPINNIEFLALEREAAETYIVTRWELGIKNENARRKQTWEIDGDTSEKIVLAYAEKLKFVKGE